MADDPDKKPDPKPATGDDPDDKPDMGDAGKKALAAERAARREAEKRAAEVEARLKELEDKDKSDSQKLTDRLATAEKRAETAESRVLRLEVAMDKGLSAVMARRITGSTKEELEADADELLASFKSSDEGDKKAPGKPAEDLKGGGDPTSEPKPDMRQIVADIPRGF